MKDFIEEGEKDVLLELARNEHVFEYEDIGIAFSKNEDWEIRYEILINSYSYTLFGMSFSRRYSESFYQTFINDNDRNIKKFVATHFYWLANLELKTLANDESQEILLHSFIIQL